WRAEQSGMAEHVCATDWLVAVCLLPHDRQDEELQRRIAARPSMRVGCWSRLPAVNGYGAAGRRATAASCQDGPNRERSRMRNSGLIHTLALTACAGSDDQGATAGAQLIAPQSLATVTQQRPTLRWISTGDAASVVELCADRSCAKPLGIATEIA